jgi:outer membrane protein OmpA-like peptidoglycan-associated protein
MTQLSKKILFLILFSLFISCASDPPAKAPASPSEEEIVSRLNRELAALEIQGYAPNQTVLPESLYQKWATKGIEGIKKVLPEIPNGYVFAATGHADPYGGEAMASRIAQGRADNMRARLIKVLGLDPNKITTKNYSTQKFTQKKDNSISQNRRVEFEVLKK